MMGARQVGQEELSYRLQLGVWSGTCRLKALGCMCGPSATKKEDSLVAGLGGTFHAFGGIPREVLLDNARTLVLHHDPASREVVLHPKPHAFAKNWGIRICSP